MNSYSIDSDSPRWWWPQAAVGAVATVAITAILAVPTAGVALPGTTPDVAPAPAHWFAPVDPESDRQCFMTRLPWNVALDYPVPRCGHVPTSDQHEWTGAPRPGLTSTP